MTINNEIVFTDGGTTLVVGETGVQGPVGPGVPNGGTSGQVLAKASAADQDTEWVTGGAGGGLTAEEVRDTVATFVVGGDNLTATHDDVGDTLTLDVTGLAAVANSGDFNDLLNQPSIPSAVTDLTGVSTYGATLVDDVDAATARTTLGLGTAATSAAADFAGAAHTHTLSDITDSGSAAASDTTDFAASSHTHTLSDVTDSGTAAPLDVAASGDAAVSEVVVGSDSRLSDARTPTAHTHTLSDITDSGSAAASDTTDFAAASHTHTLSDITDSGTAAPLDAPASGDAATSEVVIGSDSRLTDARTPTAHTHTLSDVTDSGTAAALDVAASGDAGASEVVVGDDTRLSDARTPTGHTHVEADVTDLKRVTERSYAETSGSALGTGGAARFVSTTQRKLVAAGIALDASDSGTVDIKILSAAGAVQHTASVSISGAQSVTVTSFTWDTGDGTVDAGEMVEVVRASGFTAATEINAPLRFEESV